ncbi:peptidyl-prolyl cis-trans isomerase, putative [Trypanosoma equiperdum]|uniref:peptidylprolyl isomerase n=4 Tax=Trypanozoon TaxID=39700 RepID=Q57WF7_TRYB2|nr:peptidyl-prolyl cis-trans isomerase, putative [Trypanosoma brucei gambiense DAL972]XP_845965.1 peptidyl-prolyl cis-trans isomerase, putative [Trypanosoma brucei brucei TREU927]AAX70064.1 peptidyl-prolyl cis-trans isomerase, putative [Trypanosoma brucei]RHW71205.1 peptidyl-prolyl cis-trans isomerase [Trypanosoma brucei equiperdum]SCU68535.1 peptidyl-prolyl cis-trans isomerase, putative [Trypanosoma equiperdum]AAZ12406.1 peptidyl-prolyl cis-trans isomerase, putative [Trypanosoma brucei brucei|eukprot:XP_011774719.1 peptidyl-prolyl cis-trans isomerase, putative [Trypanosoma brucei gambiense DAL972]
MSRNDCVMMDKIIEGDGKTIPRQGSIVTLDYVGYLPDGRKFDSTIERGKPFVFRVGCGEVIKGWDEGIVQMSKGERSRLTMPPSLAFGSTGFPGIIPPNTVIVFEVTLLDVV